MFDKYGEFDSVEELNNAAAGQKEQGDTNAIFEIAEENGIDKEDVQDYIEGYTDKLATLSMAAYGRIRIQEQEHVFNNKDYMDGMAIAVIITMLRGMCTDEEVQKAVMKKGRNVSEIYSAMRSAAEKHKHGNMGVSCGTDRELCAIIKSYYMETKTELEEKINALYSQADERKKTDEAKKLSGKKKSSDKKAGDRNAEKKD